MKIKKIYFLIAVALTVVTTVALIFYFLVKSQVFGPVPSTEELKAIKIYNASEILASGGEQLGKYFLYDRTIVTLEEISSNVIEALIATEDVRFYEHKGIDLRSMGRVAVKNIILGQRSAGGGSTITLQLAKNLYPRTHNNIFRLIADKFREAIIARRLEQVYSKDEIIILYLNTVAFGDNVYGISAASSRFFNKSPLQLNDEEAALLIGMLKATQNYNPRLYPERSLLRRNTVISQMGKYGFLSEQTADSLMALPIVLDYKPISHIHGPAPHFREKLRKDLVVWLDDYNNQNETDYNLYTDGLTIHTSINYELQIRAEEALERRLMLLQDQVNRHYEQASRAKAAGLLDQLIKRSKRYEEFVNQGFSEDAIRENLTKKRDLIVFDGYEESVSRMSLLDSVFEAQKLLHGAIFSIEPETGFVRAWVGGSNFRLFQFDNVLSVKQTGSSFKPFIYAAALETGMNPCDYISNQPLISEDFGGWSPENADGNYEGYYSMKGALSNSVNTVTARILKETGYEPLIDILNKAGMPSNVPSLPSLALGAIEINLFDLTPAYGIFANHGLVKPPVYLLQIENSKGEVLFEAMPENNQKPVVSERTSLLMREMLRAVTQTGTASMLGRNFNDICDIGGKTGTTQNNSDGWFVGFTPGLITGVWVGLENPAFASLYPLPFGASHSSVAVWDDYMHQASQHKNTRIWASGRFAMLPQDIGGVLDCPEYIFELPKLSWFEKLFGKPDDSNATPSDTLEKKSRRKSLFRRLLEEIF